MNDEQDNSTRVSVPGKMQGSVYFCPDGHVMIVLSGQGSLDITGICNTQGCPHKGIKYKITLPTIIFTRYEDD
jgi:hypothetical protein